MPKNFKDLTRERLRDERQARGQERPQGAGHRVQAQETRSRSTWTSSPSSEAVTFLQNYTGLNIVLDPKALNDEGVTSASPVVADREQRPAQDGLEALAQARWA